MSLVGRQFASLEELYAALPAVDCQRLCQDYCGPVIGSQEEMRRARAAGVDLAEPMLKWIELGNGRAPIPSCPALKDGACSVYESRPYICRVWGVADSLPCEYGCQPERTLSEDEGRWLLLETQRLGGPILGLTRVLDVLDQDVLVQPSKPDLP